MENKFTINQNALSILLDYIGLSSIPITMSYCFNNIISVNEWESNFMPSISRRFMRSNKNITILKPSTQDDVRNIVEPHVVMSDIRNIIEPSVVPSEEMISPF